MNFLTPAAVSVRLGRSKSSVENLLMALVEAALKSPSIPLYSKGEVSLQDSNPSLEKFDKEGKGRFLGGVRRELRRELLGQYTMLREA